MLALAKKTKKKQTGCCKGNGKYCWCDSENEKENNDNVQMHNAGT